MKRISCFWTGGRSDKSLTISPSLLEFDRVRNDSLTGSEMGDTSSVLPSPVDALPSFTGSPAIGPIIAGAVRVLPPVNRSSPSPTWSVTSSPPKIPIPAPRRSIRCDLEKSGRHVVPNSNRFSTAFLDMDESAIKIEDSKEKDHSVADRKPDYPTFRPRSERILVSVPEIPSRRKDSVASVQALTSNVAYDLNVKPRSTSETGVVKLPKPPQRKNRRLPGNRLKFFVV